MKLNTIKFSITLLLGLTIIISGCSNNNTAKPYYLISDEFAEYCYFQEGSSWIFQNDSILATDSVNISEITEVKRYASSPIQHHYQAIDMFTGNNEFNIARYEITAGSYKPDDGEMNSLLRLYFKNESYQLIFSPKYPLGEEIILGDAIGVYENVEIIENYELLNNTYEDVWHTRIIVSVNDNIEYNYWIAKNHGLIKSVTNNNGQITSISLVDSNLIP